MAGWPLPRIVAHRCGGTLAPENTLIGLEFAIAHGCRGVEFDVMLTGSGTPVLIHDETLSRTTNGEGRVCDITDEALFQLDAGRWYSDRFAGERVPRFDDAIRRCRALSMAVNIEIKPCAGFERETGAAVATAVARGWSRAEAPPVISSFSLDALDAAAGFAPGLPRALLVRQIPEDWQAQARALGVIALVCDARLLEQAVAEAVKQSGLKLAVYTENDPERATDLIDWGVDSVITDRPDKLAFLA